MLIITRYLLLLTTFLGLFSCTKSQENADLIITDAKIYSVDADFSVLEAMAIKDGKIVATGSSEDILQSYTATNTQSLKGAYIYPGFNDAHAHFVGYARGLRKVNLMGTPSWADALARVVDFQNKYPSDYIIGRGWDQNDWADKSYPHRSSLDSLFPETPVFLSRIDGHAAIINTAALRQAGLNGNETLVGGTLLQDAQGFTGILIDNATDLIKLPAMDIALQKEALLEAQANLFAKGVTSLTDAGLLAADIELLQTLYADVSLQVRINAMVSDDPSSLAKYLKAPIETPTLRVKSAKFYLDGALGSRGALLLAPYSDDSTNYGLQLKEASYFKMMADSLAQLGWQMCIHGIGDSANRLAIDIYSQALAGLEDRRWRIEHAQVVHPTDQKRMVAAGIIPSIQPTHATSDMYWAEERIGSQRMQYAYSAQSFLKLGAKLPLGTDFPVEDINPLYTLRSAYLRQDADGYPPKGFRADEALSFEDAIRGMTEWGAYASFEENKKGTLEAGKYADFVIFDKDLSTLSAQEMSSLEVQATYLNGQEVYRK
ncbi:MAG: amidohydrolase [Bacteroidetes bacterium]|nr:MAG: amidohydrolase [Bacteroidota bacterium]